MTKHYTEQEIETYRTRLTSPLETLAINEHMATCEECYGMFHERSLLSSTYDFARTELENAAREEPEHLSFDQLLAFVDNEMDEIESGIAGAHLEICSDCDEVCRDLRLFKSELAPGRQVSVPVRPTIRARIAELARAYRLPIQALAGSAAAAAIIWFIVASQRQVGELEARLNQVQQENAREDSWSKSGNKVDDSVVSNLQSQLERLSKENEELRELVASARPSGISPNSQVARQVSLKDAGGPVELDNRGDLKGIAFVSLEHEAAVADALRTGRVKPSAELANLTGEQKRLMGAANKQKSFIPLSPVGAVLATNQPTFHWKQVAGATAYIVTIYRNNLKESVSSQKLTENQWTSPPLTRGTTYSWQIRAIKDGSETVSPSPDSREARFRVLSQAEVDQLERVKENYSQSHLTLGVIYARMGLFAEAEPEFRALLKANPGSAIVKELLRSVSGGQYK